ncbi:hypothetical protein CVT26_009413 [Gymnopilus dilepis]|uniref:Uncharacterized protein n=1 Tax=Gymnopilus dilepis TaxID=231916 RepID=A0A409VK59_9AGAR|nr:hypothetical protein CVT26_009413 [Gymnopilus dilepis]
MSIRDANVVIIETGRTVVRAGLGLHDLLKTPSVEIPARVGLRRSLLGDNGDAQTNGNANSIDGPTASTSRATSVYPQTSIPKAKVTDYLVGTQLDEALANGQDLIVSWPFAAGVVTGNSRDTHERICQIFFERFNVAGFAILERPMAQMYAANSLSGVVVDIGDEVTDVTPIYEGFIYRPARGKVTLGMRHCEIYVANLLRSNPTVMNALSPPENPTDPETLQSTLVDLVKQLWKDDTIKIPSTGETAVPDDNEGVLDIAAVVVTGKEKAVIESNQKKKNQGKQTEAEKRREREIEAMDLITVDFRGHSLTIGKERHRFCEPLFDPTLLNGLIGFTTPDEAMVPIQDVVGNVVNQLDIDQRQYVWQGVFVTGDITRHVRGIGAALQSRVAPFIVSPDVQSDVQPRSVRVLSVPEYYAEYRETGNSYAAFLGSSITAKIIFGDSNGKNYVSKAEYTNKGPHSIIEMTPSLL